MGESAPSSCHKSGLPRGTLGQRHRRERTAQRQLEMDTQHWERGKNGYLGGGVLGTVDV